MLFSMKTAIASHVKSAIVIEKGHDYVKELIVRSDLSSINNKVSTISMK